MSELSTKAPDPMDIALGAAVRIRRRTIGISQEALADQCGVSFQQIQKYENGANRISFSRLVQIARALRCRVVDLMDVLDGPDPTMTGDMDALTRMRTPGAVELLTAYEKMKPEARNSLVALLRCLTPDMAEVAEVADIAEARRQIA
jgi:transcriptional regulator with XRE-family HTH domain